MRIGLVGCGYVADFYLQTMANYPELKVAGVTDCDLERARRIAAMYQVPQYQNLSSMLAEPSIELVVNLTNPRSHFVVSKAALDAGKHVYSEKPLSMEFEQAEQLVRLAESRGLYLSSAPCSVLGETAQTIWKALREDAIGKVRLVYAEMDDGCIHTMRYKEWRSRSGTPWPYKDEFEVGCTLEHAGYYVTWLTTFFGPAKTVTAYSSCLVPDKLCELEVIAPDFSVACLEFASGVMARLTCSIVAPRNHSLRLMGDGGFLATDNGWDYSSPIYFKHYNHPTRGVKSKLMRLLFKSKRLRALLRHPELRYPLARKCDFHLRYGVGSHQMDFARGIAELADAITNKRPCRLSARHALHVDEIVLTMQYPERMGCPRTLRTSFEPVEPMTWAVARSNVKE